MDYKNGKIYCIRNSIDDEVYVGSTCQPLSKRMARHRASMKLYKENRKFYKHMNDKGVENFYIELIEECPCDNKEQLRRREGHFIREMATLNKQIAGQSKEEYRNKNKDEINEKRRIKITCGCGTCYNQGDKPRHERSMKHKKLLETQQ